jgi:hypothetical protein
LLHSCWCIAFGCWNSDSKFEFYLFESFPKFLNLSPLPTLILSAHPSFLARSAAASAAAQLAAPAALQPAVACVAVHRHRGPVGLSAQSRRQPTSPELARAAEADSGSRMSSPLPSRVPPDSAESRAAARVRSRHAPVLGPHAKETHLWAI